MDAAIPAITFSQMFNLIYEWCIQIHCSNFKIYKPHRAATPAAHVQSFLNGAVVAGLPSHENWCKLIATTPSCPQFFVLLKIREPSLSATWTKQNLMQT
jgi:hypothetical protein